MNRTNKKKCEHGEPHYVICVACQYFILFRGAQTEYEKVRGVFDEIVKKTSELKVQRGVILDRQKGVLR